ncbi:MAG: hypothetical protein QNJ31_02900 [Candidatus Caenarcaniphilales bacterium]|nr:hypothetical protein [Candidatus Caenarcaniphilales bacterium]
MSGFNRAARNNSNRPLRRAEDIWMERARRGQRTPRNNFHLRRSRELNQPTHVINNSGGVSRQLQNFANGEDRFIRGFYPNYGWGS